jgi:hypothetical protein
MSKLPTEINSEAKRAIALAFEGMGSLPKLINWARTHPMEFYTQVYIKLLPYTVEAKIDATINSGEQARAKLQDAFQRLIASRTIDAVVNPPPLPEPPQIRRAIERDDCVVIDEPKATGFQDPRADAEAKPPFVATVDNASATPPNDAAAEARRRAMEPSYRPPIMNTAAAEQDSTALFYDYYNNGGGKRLWWGPVGESAGPP